MNRFLRTQKIIKNLTGPGNFDRIAWRALLWIFLSILSLARIKNKTVFGISFLYRTLLKFLIVLVIILRSNVCFSQIVINEVGIAPTGGTDGNGGEYIELFNKSACTQNIGCFVIEFSGTSGTGNATGWTIKIPSGLSIPSGGYFIIGGIAGQAGVVSGT